jgi:hypothetical protein
VTGPRRWARRAMLSALAGGGLTAAGLGGPLAGGALGAEAATGTSPAGESPSPPVTATTPQASAPAPAAGQPASSTSTTPAPSSTSTAPSTPASPPGGPGQGAPIVVVQRKQQTTSGERTPGNVTKTGSKQSTGATAPGKTGTPGTGPTTVPPGTPNGVAPAPQAIGGEAGGLAALLTGSAVSAQALNYYRIPLFLLPIYQAAAVQYDVPWQILAAINEVETNYGADQSVSTAGAVGWMQFMPQTWLQYGVDATAAGYADPYNPVDAIFAAARYLHAAGASHNLSQAILAYNHSQAYVESVLLRAHLISSYPRSAIATLTGLVDGRPPTTGARLSSAAALTGSLAPGAAPTAAGAPSPSSTSSSATAGAVPAAATAAIAPSPAVVGASLHATAAGQATPDRSKLGQPGASGRSFTPPPPPQVVAARAEAAVNAPARAGQLVDLLGAVHGPVVAVQDGRVVHLGRSHALGKYLVLRDIYGDVFTYAGLGNIVPRYRAPEPHPPRAVGTPTREPAPTQPASAGHQPPLTLKVRAHAGRTVPSTAAVAPVEVESEAGTAPPGMGRVRLFAHPDNPIARVVAARAARAAAARNSRWRMLQVGSIVSQGTVLGHLNTPPRAHAGHMRFAIRPAGDSNVIDPQPILSGWRQLGAALHPKGSKAKAVLVGATVAEVFLMSKSELERAALADPGIQISQCGRRDIAGGAVDMRVLAVLEFLSRSGLQPTVGALRCSRGGSSASGSAHSTEDGVAISAINGIPIAGHQGPGTITDTTIRALLALQGRFVPHRIVSLMKYPEAANTLALSAAWNSIHIDFLPRKAATVPLGSAAGAHAHRQTPLAVSGDLSPVEWARLISRIAALPQPTVVTKPSSAAIRDPQAAPTNHGLGVRGLSG